MLWEVTPTHLRNNSDTTPMMVRLKSEKSRSGVGDDTVLSATNIMDRSCAI